jgi:hypothetical protein
MFATAHTQRSSLRSDRVKDRRAGRGIKSRTPGRARLYAVIRSADLEPIALRVFYPLRELILAIL